MPTFARGFKRDCERIVSQVREQLHTADYEPIDMVKLARELDIPLVSLTQQVEQSGIICNGTHLAEIYAKVSAFTQFKGYRRTIVYNDRHLDGRHRSNLGHEFAHALLHHPPEGSTGDASRENMHEQEAAWLSGVLLLTEKQALHIAIARVDTENAMTQYAISREMLRYRLNVTAAYKRAGY